MENLSISDCLMIMTCFTAAFAFVGLCFFIMELFQQRHNGDALTFWEVVKLGISSICFATLIGIVISLIVCAITYVACALGLDPADMPENPYF